MSGRRIKSEVLHAYHDGELGRLARWRTERRLARDPEARAELVRLARVRSAVREAASGAPVPELWPGISERLAALDAELGREAMAGRGVSPVLSPAAAGLRAWLRPLAAGAAVAAAAAAWLVFSAPTEAVDQGVVRWLYTRGRPVMVLDRPEDATIIWLLDETPGDQTGRRRPGDYI